MKFKTDDLIARIDNLLRHLEGEAIDRAEKHDEALEGSRDAWLEGNSEGFRQFALTILRRLNSYEAVTISDMPASIKGYGNTSLNFYFAPNKIASAAEDRRADNLLKLKAALQASTEDTVSPTALKQLGFQDATLLFTPEAAA